MLKVAQQDRSHLVFSLRTFLLSTNNIFTPRKVSQLRADAFPPLGFYEGEHFGNVKEPPDGPQA